MSKHRSKHYDECCYNGYGYGMGGFTGGYAAGAGGGGGCGLGYGGWGIRWIYALLVLIVIVLQFGRRDTPLVAATTACDETLVAPATVGGGVFNGEFIDRSVLFIIVVFLLILCAGCWVGGAGNYGTAGVGYGGGYGY